MNIERQKERQVEYLRRRVMDLEDLVVRLNQQMPFAMMTGGGMGGGGGGGAFYADPGGTVIAAGDSEDMEVMEVLMSGDISVGTKTVINRHSEDTLADLRLFLIKCRDGSFMVDNQDCPEPA